MTDIPCQMLAALFASPCKHKGGTTTHLSFFLQEVTNKGLIMLFSRALFWKINPATLLHENLGWKIKSMASYESFSLSSMLLAEHCTVFSRRSRLQRSQPRRRGKNPIRLPIGLTTHGYSLISRAAIRLAERGYSGANVLKRVPSLESYFSGRCFHSFQLSAPVTVCASLA